MENTDYKSLFEAEKKRNQNLLIRLDEMKIQNFALSDRLESKDLENQDLRKQVKRLKNDLLDAQNNIDCFAECGYQVV